MRYLTFLRSFSELRQARWANLVSVDTETISTPNFFKASNFSAKSASSVGQTNVKSAG
jgi:hypothetical protein